MRRLLVACVVAVVAGVVVSLAAGGSGATPAGRWVIRDLGTLGGDWSEAVAINAGGEVIGSSFTATEGSHGFIWMNGKMTDLGPGEAVAVNDKGQVLVVVIGLKDDRYRSRLWEAGRLRELPTLPGWWHSHAAAINERGQIVGWRGNKPSGSDAVGVQHAVLWQNGRITDLGTLGGTSSEATAINERGQIAGWSQTKTGDLHAFLWHRGKMTDLGAGGSEAAMNDHGQIVSGRETASGNSRAVLWSDGRMRDLGTLGGAVSEATAINDRGQIIGRSQVRRNLYRAFVWQNGEMSDLGTRWATALNDRGQIVGATGIKSGKTHAYLWQNGRLTDLGALGGPANDSEAVAINNQHQIVGTSEGRAVLWTWQPAK